MSSQLEQPRRATPTIPPGFSAPVIPRPLGGDLLVRPISRNALSSVVPAVPFVPATPTRITTPGKGKKDKQAVEPADVQDDTALESVATSKAKPQTPVKATRKTGIAKSQAPETPKANADDLVITEREEDKAAISSPVKGTSKSKASDKNGQVTSTESPEMDKKHAINSGATPVSSKRQHPGKLDIAAATEMSENEQSSATGPLKTDSQPRNLRTVSMTSTTSVPASPAATSTGSPIKRSTAPRTLRVVPTPKTEVPPPLSAVSTTSVPHVPTVDKLRSRQASIASLNQPGTPASELISDTASVTSASISRASSPPPLGSKVGTAPVRKKTKSQAKKERQERKRQIEEEQAMTLDEHKSDIESVQAPIIGRKKKSKKPASNPKSTVAVIKSQPPSPKPTKVEEDEEKQDQEQVETKVTSPPSPKRDQTAKLSASSNQKPDMSPATESASASEQSKDRRELTAQSIIADLQKTGELLASTLEFFKPLSSSLAHASRNTQSNSTTAPPDLKIHFSEADLDALAKKMPVRLNGQDGKSDSRTLITPQGKFFWGLPQELEEKALELERHIEELKGQARFHPRKQMPQTHTHNIAAHAHSKDVLPAIATALKEAGQKLSKNASSSSPSMPKLDPTSTLLGSTSLPLPPVQPPNDSMFTHNFLHCLIKSSELADIFGAPAPQQPPPQPQTPTDASAYLNQFVLPQTDNPSPNQPRPEMAAVGGPPAAGTGNMTVNVGKIAKAAKVVAEGGTLNTEIDGMGMMAADLLGGVVVQGLEALVGAGLGFHNYQDLGMDRQGNVTLGRGGLDVQGLVSAIESGGALSGFGGSNGARRNGRSVLSIDEAEQAMLAAKKDQDALEKKLASLMKRNKKFVSGTGKV